MTDLNGTLKRLAAVEMEELSSTVLNKYRLMASPLEPVVKQVKRLVWTSRIKNLCHSGTDNGVASSRFTKGRWLARVTLDLDVVDSPQDRQ